MSYIEAIGTIFGLINIWLASKEKYSNFYFGLVNVTLFGIIFFQIQLYSNLLLQIFFFAMNIYGLYSWRKHSQSTDNLKIHWLAKSHKIITIIISMISITILSFYINDVFAALTAICINLLNLFGANLALPVVDPDLHPIIDSSITVLSIVAMILMTRKVAENWLIWCLINILSIYLYAIQGVYLMSIEYILLLFIAIKGSIEWIKEAAHS